MCVWCKYVLFFLFVDLNFSCCFSSPNNNYSIIIQLFRADFHAALQRLDKSPSPRLSFLYPISYLILLIFTYLKFGIIYT